MNRINFTLTGPGSILSALLKNKQGRSIISFVRDNNLKAKLIGETSWFLASNLIYSASTYLMGFLIPYFLNTEFMANFTAGNQILMVLSFIFEMGFSITFIRYFQIDKTSKYVNSFLETVLFILLVIIGFNFSGFFNNLFKIDSLPVDYRLFYFLVISQLSWFFIKNWLLAINKLKAIVYHSAIILVLRLGVIAHLYLNRDFSLNQLFIETMLIPFIPSLLHLLIVNTKILAEGVPLLKGLNRARLRNIGAKILDFLRFSLMTHAAGFVYLYTGRYLVIYLTGRNNTVLADMGYAMTFIGIILVFYASLRSYIVARLNINRMDFIIQYVQNVKSLFKYVFIFMIGLSALFSYVVYLIKPHYLTFNTVIFSFILFLANFISVYLGFITLLSKTLDYVKTEVILNIVRLLLVIAITNTLIPLNPVMGVAVINLAVVLVEVYFAHLISKRLENALQTEPI